MKKRKILSLFLACSLAATMFTAVPASADTTTTTLTQDNPTGTLTITLKIKGTATVTTAPTAISGLNYSGSPVALVTAGEATGGTMVYSLDGTNFSPDIPKAESAGTYTVYFYAKGNEDNNDSEPQSLTVNVGTTSSLTITLTIKAAAEVTTFPTAKTELNYSGTALELVNAGTATGGTMQYSLDGTNFSPDIPKAEAAGTYTVYYYAKGDSDHKDSEVGSVPVTVGYFGALTITLTIAPKLTVTYNANGADGTAPVDETKYANDAEVTVLGAGTLTKTGYTFAGWNTKADGTGTTYAADATFTITADTTLYAQWTVNQYTITFDTDGGSPITAITQDYDTAITKPADPTKEGYKFTAWSPEIPSKMPAENITVKAGWSVNSYTITFVTDGGTAIDAITQDYGTTVTAPANPTKTGYTFDGWDKTIPATMPAEDMTVTAKWKVNQYTITFDTKGGSTIAPITQDYGSAVTAPANPTKAGYTFAAWDKQIPTAMPAENITITASWTVDQYTITFDTDGGSDVKAITADYGTTVTKPANPTKTGYTFDGWDKEIPAAMPAENITVKAKWKINQYTITFDTDGGTEIAPITQDYGTAVTAPENPTRTGYKFTAWTPEIPSTMPAENITIKAGWSANAYTITFITDGGTAIDAITADYGAAVTKPADPTKIGYTFDGWDKDIPETMPAEDMTITAKWKVNQYTITFNTNGGTEIAPITQDYGTAITAPANPTRSGYTFTGWNPAIPSTMPAENLTVNAQWSSNAPIYIPTPITPVVTTDDTTTTTTTATEEEDTTSETVNSEDDTITTPVDDDTEEETEVNTDDTDNADDFESKEQLDETVDADEGGDAEGDADLDMTVEVEKTADDGAFENTTDEDANLGGAALRDDANYLEDAVLTAEEKAAVAAGETVEVYLEVEEMTPPAAEQQAIEQEVEQIAETAAGDVQVGFYFDASLFKKVGNRRAEPVHETNGLVTVSFAIPTEFINTDPNVTRTYSIARLHDAIVTILPCKFSISLGTLSFMSDEFSTYALIYEDTEKEVTETAVDAVVDTSDDNNPHTNAPLAGMGVFAAMSFFAATAAYTAKKKKK